MTKGLFESHDDTLQTVHTTLNVNVNCCEIISQSLQNDQTLGQFFDSWCGGLIKK